MDGVAHKAEEELFNDPYGVLSRLALKASSDDADKGAESANALPGGDAYTNPFEPFADRTIPVPPKEEPPMSLEAFRFATNGAGSSRSRSSSIRRAWRMCPRMPIWRPSPSSPGSRRIRKRRRAKREVEALEAELGEAASGPSCRQEAVDRRREGRWRHS